jgi:Carboxypeptidase regulatory-like domain
MFWKNLLILCLFALLLTACGQNTTTPTGPSDNPNNPPSAQTEPNSVSGIALDTMGNPIANARIWIEPAVTTGLYNATTDANGCYIATDLPTVPYYAKAWTYVTHNGEDFCLRLGMAQPSVRSLYTRSGYRAKFSVAA